MSKQSEKKQFMPYWVYAIFFKNRIAGLIMGFVFETLLMPLVFVSTAKLITDAADKPLTSMAELGLFGIFFVIGLMNFFRCKYNSGAHQGAVITLLGGWVHYYELVVDERGRVVKEERKLTIANGDNFIWFKGIFFNIDFTETDISHETLETETAEIKTSTLDHYPLDAFKIGSTYEVEDDDAFSQIDLASFYRIINAKLLTAGTSVIRSTLGIEIKDNKLIPTKINNVKEFLNSVKEDDELKLTLTNYGVSFKDVFLIGALNPGEALQRDGQQYSRAITEMKAKGYKGEELLQQVAKFQTDYKTKTTTDISFKEAFVMYCQINHIANNIVEIISNAGDFTTSRVAESQLTGKAVV